MAWWSPICAYRQISNVFALEYRIVNVSVFYINLSLMGALSLVFSKVKNMVKDRTSHVKIKPNFVDGLHLGFCTNWINYKACSLC